MDNVFHLGEQRRRRSAQQQTRDGRGRFESLDKDPLPLLKRISAVSQVAAGLFPEDCSIKPPRIPGDKFDSARRLAEGEIGGCSSANCLAQRLRKMTETNYPWSFWVDVALDPDQDIEKGAQEPDGATGPQARSARGGICSSGGGGSPPVPTLSEPEYDERRERLLKREQGSGRGTFLAERSLPTGQQIRWACGTWEAALMLAGLESVAGAPEIRLSAASDAQ